MMKHTSIKHTLVISTYTWSKDRLIEVGYGLFKFNTRGHSDHENVFSYVYGRFIQDQQGKKNGTFYFQYNLPSGETQLSTVDIKPEGEWYNVESVEINTENH